MNTRPFLALIAAGGLLAATVTAPQAHATPSSDLYAAQNGPRICSVLDAYPTFEGLMGIADAIHTNDGFTYRAAGEIEGLAIITFCPRHLPLLKSFINAYTTPPALPVNGIGGTFRA